MQIVFDPAKDEANRQKHGLSLRFGAMVDDTDNPEWTDENTDALDYSAKLKVVRARLMMSQGDFAKLLRIPVATLRNWEQRRTVPDAPALALIELIYQDPREIRARLERAAE